MVLISNPLGAISYVVRVVFELGINTFLPALSLIATSANTYVFVIVPPDNESPVTPPAKSLAPMIAPPT